ncbi:MAG: MazG-like family protein [Gemmataceae bacterium]
MADHATPVSELREAMRRFVSDRDWGQFHSPKNLAMALAAEAAELMEHFLWMSEDESRRQLEDPVRREAICDEIADVVGVCLALCNALDLDLSELFARKMAKNVVKYPVEKARGRYRLED